MEEQEEEEEEEAGAALRDVAVTALSAVTAVQFHWHWNSCCDCV